MRTFPRRRLAGALAVLLSAFCPLSAAMACSCAAESEALAVRRADLAVVATAIADAPFDVRKEPSGLSRPSRAVTLFRVERVRRGAFDGERMAVLHRTDSAACGLRFSAGERYLLAFRFRAGKTEPGPLRIGFCGARRWAGLARRPPAGREHSR